MGKTWLVVTAFILVACVPPAEPDQGAALEPGLRFSTTFGDADGNRYVAGRADLAPANRSEYRFDGAVDGTIGWLVGIGDGEDTVLVVAGEHGNLAGIRETAGVWQPEDLNISLGPAGTPPALVSGKGVLVVLPPVSGGALETNALALDTGGLAFISSDGDVIVADGAGNRRIEVDALPDGRLTLSNDRRLAVLVGPTDRYDHGVVGDRFEASGIVFISLDTQEVVGAMNFASDVIEGMVGMFADLDSDGIEEYIVTVSNAETGARLVVFDEEAKVVAESDPIGQGGRWRHQIAAGPFGPHGEIELVDVRTPHIGGVVEYFAMRSGRLELVASMAGYSSHNIHSRNLDMALALDVDGDGQAEMVVPSEAKDALVVLRRVVGGVEVAMTLPLGGVLSSNLVAVPGVDGHVILAAATTDGRLLIWE